MDPEKAWRQLAEAIANDDSSLATELADGLLAWLDRNGFPPKITGLLAFDRMVVEATCDRIVAWEVP